jgi:hypothetical protein
LIHGCEAGGYYLWSLYDPSLKFGRHWKDQNTLDRNLVNFCIRGHLRIWVWFWTIFQILIAEVMCTQARHLTENVGTWAAWWNYCWAIPKYMVDWIPSSLKTRCDGCTCAFHCCSAILALGECILVRKHYQETGGICWHPTLAQLSFVEQSGQIGQTYHPNWSDRSRQLCQIDNWTSPLRRSRWDDRNADIEHPIWTPDEEVMPPGRPAPRSDRFGGG